MLKRYLLCLCVCISIFCNGQSLDYNWFIRTPQVANFNFNTSKFSLTPVVSTGFGLSHKAKYIEAGSFISQNDIYGYFTFFGSTLKSKELDEQWNLDINWFGEVAIIPNQPESKNTCTQTAGLCFFINHPFKWGNIGIPLCIGLAHTNGSFS